MWRSKHRQEAKDKRPGARALLTWDKGKTEKTRCRTACDREAPPRRAYERYGGGARVVCSPGLRCILDVLSGQAESYAPICSFLSTHAFPSSAAPLVIRRYEKMFTRCNSTSTSHWKNHFQCHEVLDKRLPGADPVSTSVTFSSQPLATLRVPLVCFFCMELLTSIESALCPVF